MKHAEIAGAGFAGLVAAIALADRGWTVRVHEKTPFVRAEGFGLSMQENMLKILEAVGVREEVVRGGQPIRQRLVLDAQGRTIMTSGGGFGWRISRSHIISALLERAKRAGVEVETESRAVGAEASGELLIANGRRLKADLVVGADGIHSAVRDSLGIHLQRRTRPDGAMRVLVPRPASTLDPSKDGTTRESWSGQRRFIVSRTRPDELYVAMSCRASDVAGRSVPLDVASWSQTFPEQAEFFAWMNGEADWSAVRWVRFETLRLARWHAGRVAIVGDAAHAMPPDLGQGAGCAMMNALSLACYEDLSEWEKHERPPPSILSAGQPSTGGRRACRDRFVRSLSRQWAESNGCTIAISAPRATFRPDTWRSEMLVERIEGKWIEAFRDVFQLCAVKPGEVVAILSETQSRKVLVELSELALHQLGARAFHVQLVSPPVASGVPVRSTGTSLAVAGLEPVIQALAATGMVVDCTVEGMLHAAELPRILAGGTRLMMISNEHPEVLERTKPTPELRERVRRGMQILGSAKHMRVTSAAGTDLDVHIDGAPARGAPGFVNEPGKVGYWPAGLCLCFPRPGSVNGTVVLAPGDVNLTFKRYIESPVRMVIENDYVTKIEGEGLDAALLRSYYEAWRDREAYATSHVGWGMNLDACAESMMMYDRKDINGTELRAFAGNFLYSTGANESAKRFTACHFDFPLRDCSVELDGKKVVDRGRLSAELA